MLAALKALLGFSGVADTALKVVERVSGVDDSPQEKRQFLLDWLSATKHQSPMRRVIALTITLVWALFVSVWLAMTVLSSFLSPDLAESAQIAKEAIEGFMETNITTPLNIIVSFYFVGGMINNFKK
jgi:hypothetical protein